MTAVEMLHRDNDYRLLRAQEDPQANAYWCFMHAARFPQATGYREMGLFAAPYVLAVLEMFD